MLQKDSKPAFTAGFFVCFFVNSREHTGLRIQAIRDKSQCTQ